MLVRENKATVDGRLFTPGSIRWYDGDRPWRLVAPPEVEFQGERVWWEIERLWREGDDVWGEGFGPADEWRPTAELDAMTSVPTAGPTVYLVVTSATVVGAMTSPPTAQCWPDLPFMVTE